MYVVKVNSCPECGSTKLKYPLKNVRYFGKGGSVGTPVKTVKQCKSCGMTTKIDMLKYVDIEVDDNQRLCPECLSPKIQKSSVYSDGIPCWSCEGCGELMNLHEFMKAKQMEGRKGVEKIDKKEAIIKERTGAPYDCFISHASEDKSSVARPLFEILTRKGKKVWFDEAELKLGDSLRRKIDSGLASCRYGIVILSHSFFDKEWPQSELDGLVARETSSRAKVILPVWHEIDKQDIINYSPILADKLSVNTGAGIDNVAAKILDVIQ